MPPLSDRSELLPLCERAAFLATLLRPPFRNHPLCVLWGSDAEEDSTKKKRNQPSLWLLLLLVFRTLAFFLTRDAMCAALTDELQARQAGGRQVRQGHAEEETGRIPEVHFTAYEPPTHHARAHRQAVLP